MKRFSLLGLLAVTMGLLAGCPIYDDNSPVAPGAKDGVGGTTNATTLPADSCFAQSDCAGINQTCGSDNQCHTGDCTLWGCVNHQACVVGQDQKAHCGDAGGNGGAGGTGTTGTTTTITSTGEGGSIGGSGGTGTTGTTGMGGAAGGTMTGTAGGGNGGAAGAGNGGAAGSGAAGAAGAGAGGAAGGGSAGAAGSGGNTGTTTTTT
jgi:hypothetical protein